MSLLNKFRGCLAGALMGDCIGSAFEGDSHVDLKNLKSHLDRTERLECDNITLQETDDTEMTQELASSLIAKRCFDPKDLAHRFVTRYYLNEGQKGYGQNVVSVFAKLRDTNCQEPYKPASEQFGGSGSYGNGAAMRVSPVACVTLDNVQHCAKLAEHSARITHTHEEGRHGAIFQALAVRRCLLGSATSSQKFIDDLRGDLQEVGISEDYLHKLEIVSILLAEDKVQIVKVAQRLGNSVAALHSVPTALYCFLRALQPIDQFPSIDVFRRCIELAISLGGDTDTIASMAGALSGAHLGLDKLNETMWRGCPLSEKTISLADVLFKVHSEGFNFNLF